MRFNENKLKLLISKILKVKPNKIKDNSGLGQSSNWDSIGHLKILLAIVLNLKLLLIALKKYQLYFQNLKLKFIF